MPVKIRLQRRGKKGQPFYHIVIADGRAPRDGKFIDKIGTYNPLTKPAEIDIEFDRALDWLKKGAQPTDTVRALLSYKGIMYKHHLLKGVAKGALTLEQAEVKFQAWLQEKQAKVAGIRKDVELKEKELKKKELADETKVNETKAAALAAKIAKAEEEAKAASAAKAAEAAAAAGATKEVAPTGENSETPAPESESKTE
ncbi:MAG: 30S ribosomal protein S16 [Bacteroidota bacterium]|nr:30S ribosomal protein S16 [Bacteroidota bacterium]